MPISDTTFFGGSTFVSSGSNISIHKGFRFWVVDATANIDGTLPDATTLRLGGPHFYIVNLNATFTLDVKDDGGTSIVQLDQNEIAILVLIAQADANGIWKGSSGPDEVIGAA